jgi:serine/threonine protein kinase
MTSERWRRIEELYHAALALPASERPVFLREACAGDEALRQEVAALVAETVSRAGFLDTPALALAAHGIGLRVGEALGPYAILGPLGSGGMGVVYRAHDAKLGRDVALKILFDEFARDPERLARFKREAQVLASLSHPHIGAIFGFEDSSDVHALVLELIDGPTLAERLTGLRAKGSGLPIAEALLIARQIAEALEAAHDIGIVHRDLKPANIKITPVGVVKVLDFGLAKVVEGDTASPELTKLTLAANTGARVIGTPAYMSPEQARGQTVDKRTDIWAFGCVLFEMLTGTAAFAGATVTDTLAAIIEREPDWTALPATTPPAIHRLLRRCLEKDARRRLHDIADARLEIEDPLPSTTTSPEPTIRRRVLAPMLWLFGGLVVATGFVVAERLFAERPTTPDPPVYHQITFRRGSVQNARFAPDGQTVVYSANWNGQPLRFFSSRIDNPEPLPLPFDKNTLLAISSTGQMAIRLTEGATTAGTLAVVPLAGGQAPRELVRGVVEADWSPRGDTLVVTRKVGERFTLESPPGTVLYDSGQRILSPHFSPKGDAIAFIEISTAGRTGTVGGGARIEVVDLARHVKVLSEGWGEAFSLSWAPDGNEIWFSAREATSQSGGLELHAVTLSGRQRVVARLPGILFLRQVWSDGRVLLDREDWPVTMVCRPPGATDERNLSWLDFSTVKDISADGRAVLFDEAGIAGGSRGAVFLRRLDGSPAVRLGDGQSLGLSPNGASALTFLPDARDELRIVPTGPGETRIVRAKGLTYTTARWFPDGKRLLVAAREPQRTPSLFVQAIESGTLRRIVEDASDGVISPDSLTVATIGETGDVTLTPVDGGRSRVVHGAPAGAGLIRWSDSNRYLFIQEDSLFPARILKLDLDTGHAEPWQTLRPADIAGVAFNNGYLALSADGRSYCYSYVQFLSSLLVVDGLK